MKIRQIISNLGWDGVFIGVAGLAAVVLGLLDFTSLVTLTDDPALKIIITGIGIILGATVALNARRTDERNRHIEVLNAIYALRDTVKQNNWEVSAELDDLYKTLTSTATIKPLIGQPAVYNECTKLIKGCKGSEILRATSLASTERSSGTDDPSTAYGVYLETLAKKVGEEKQRKLGMVYKTVMGYLPDQNGEPPADRKQSIQRRREVFKKHNAIDRLEIRWIDNTWSLDILIVGNEHLVIAFPTVAGDTELRLGIRVSDTELASNVARWYDEHLWRNSKILLWMKNDETS